MALNKVPTVRIPASHQEGTVLKEIAGENKVRLLKGPHKKVSYNGCRITGAAITGAV